MRWLGQTMAGLVAAVTLATGCGAETAPAPTVPPPGLTILSYNVEGLPWPVAQGRSAAAAAIAAQLRALRAAGTQPQVVAVQEAFGRAEKRIGREAGYAYAAYGPSHHMIADDAASSADRAFMEGGSAWKGETIGKHANSGLAIFSDYPILWTKRIAYPAFACAGFDCLANKGALAVAVQPPGSARPIVVVDTHLNSSGAAHVSASRTSYAYTRQVDLLSRFIASAVPADADVVLTGDFNVDRNPVRRDYLAAHLMSGAGLTLAAVEHECGLHCRQADEPGQGIATLRLAKSMLAFRTAPERPLRASGPVMPFGHAPDGAMLSDHVGLAMRFGLGAES